MTEENQLSDDTDDRSKISKFTIDLSQGLQRRIRLAASQNGLSISEYLERILNTAVLGEPSATEHWQPLPHDFLQQVYQVREQVMRDSKEELFEDSTELIRQMREERSRELEQL